jgi:predicted dehydrogenase
MFVKHGLDPQEESLRSGLTPTDPRFGEEPRQRWGRVITDEGEREVPTEPGSYASFYAGVAASLESGAPPPVDPRDAVAVLEILDEARSS